MNLNIPLLQELCMAPGAPGSEMAVRHIVLRELEGQVDEVRTDHMGNVIALRRGREARRVMAAAHMDEIAFMVTHIDKDGFARFHPLGGFDPKTLTAQRVIVHGRQDLIGVMGTRPIHLMSADDRNKPAKLSDYYIDFGMPGDRVREIVRVGDRVTRERDMILLGDCVSTKSLDNRVSVFILLEALRQMGPVPYDFYACFTVQEEVGLRGATTATRQINPEFGFGLDTTIANDLPGAAEHEKITSLGAGAAIKILDGSVISDVRMVRYLEEVAQRQGIAWQSEILTAGGTDTGAIQRSGDGAIAGCISVPTRHIHSVVEMCHLGDIRACIDLLTHAVISLDQFSHSW
ncbi:MAG: M42 family metallopeptidase [Bacteroidia bacterium]|jgi:endoglucanase|nr:M42 family metallopeptidase [Bacteroidia bacterium]